jgi:succinate dehydrogenase/fumarate reductase flavoprotein subunit
MEKSVKGEWSGIRSFPPYGTGNTHNTWYACNLVDADGREIPWADRDGRILTDISQRHRPAPGQKLFLKGGGEPDIPNYEFQGPDILPIERLMADGFKLPFYADLAGMPEQERKAIWGLMVGEEGKTKIPILKTYTEAGFDPKKHLLQSYGEGWKSGGFLPQERQLFGLPGGMVNDWGLRTNLEGLYAAGDQLFAANCHGHAAATGHYAGRHAAEYAKETNASTIDSKQAERERLRVYAPIKQVDGIGWQELNMGITRVMQHYCGDIKSEELLTTGLGLLKDIKNSEAPLLSAQNPHELVRELEVLNVLTNAEIVMNACLARKASSKPLHFRRSDYPDMDPSDWNKFVTIKLENNKVTTGEKPLDYYGPLEEKYESHNFDYLKERQS